MDHLNQVGTHHLDLVKEVETIQEDIDHLHQVGTHHHNLAMEVETIQDDINHLYQFGAIYYCAFCSFLYCTL